MKRWSPAVLRLAAALAASGPDPAAAGLTADTLESGLTRIIIEDHQAPTVAVQVWVKAGSALERPGLDGVAHLVEHLQFLRSGSGGSFVFDRFLAPVGAAYDAETHPDAVIYTTTVPAPFWLDALTIEMGRLSPAPVPDSLFRREVRVMEAEIRGLESRLDHVVRSMLLSAVFPGHPYEPQGVAADADMEHLGPQDALDFLTTWYRPDRIAVIVAGDVEASRAAGEVERLAADLTGRAPETAGADLPVPRRRDIRLHRPGTLHQLHLAFSVPPPGEAPDPWPVLADLMAGGRGGLLDRALVDSLGLAYGCEAVYEPGVFGGLFHLQVTLSREPDFDRVRHVLEAMLEELSSAGPPAGAVERSVDRLAAARAMSLDTHAGQAREAGWQWVRSSSPPHPEGIDEPSTPGIAPALMAYGAPDRRVWLTVAGEEEGSPSDESNE